MPLPVLRTHSTRSDPQCGQRGLGCQNARAHWRQVGRTSVPFAAARQYAAPALRVSGSGRVDVFAVVITSAFGGEDDARRNDGA